MGLTDRDIICFSSHFWDERWFRKQEFMSRFAHKNRILFVEPSFSMARPPEQHLRKVATNRYFISRVDDLGEGGYLFKPPRALPKWTIPRISKATFGWYGALIDRAVKRLGFVDPIVWIYEPRYFHALRHIAHSNLVLDLVDDVAAYDHSEAFASYIEECLVGLVSMSDLLVVSAKTLAELYGPSASRVVHIANGFDADRFTPAREQEDLLVGVPRPIIGFIGTLFTFLDFDLLELVARTHRDKSLVLVGPVERTARDLLARVTRYENVIHIDAQPQDTIPAYVSSFDVCLNPFLSNRAADSVNPLKVYEYLAMGRPVVSTLMKALQMEDVASVIKFASDHVKFCDEIAECLDPCLAPASDVLRAAALPYSWERLFEKLNAVCAEVLTR